MRILKTDSGHEIAVYSSAKEMPIGRYSDFQKYLISDIGVEQLNGFLERAKAYTEEAKQEDAIVEINNALQAITSLKSGVSILTYAFAVLVAQIDGNGVIDTTFEGLTRIIETLRSFDITQAEIEDAILDVKKKLNSN